MTLGSNGYRSGYVYFRGSRIGVPISNVVEKHLPDGHVVEFYFNGHRGKTQARKFADRARTETTGFRFHLDYPTDDLKYFEGVIASASVHERVVTAHIDGELEYK